MTRYLVYLKGTSLNIFTGYSWQAVENFCRENDYYNRYYHGWDVELDEYEVVCQKMAE